MSAGSTLQLALDLSGTFVFGLNGALTAMEAEDLDIIGVVVLAVITALGGGIIRDVLIGSLPPAAFRDWRYLAVGCGAGIAAFLARRLWVRVQRSITVFDAAGLALFCVTGTTTAFAAHLGPFQSVVLGTVTGVGGGTVRDVVIRKVPTVLSSGLYAIPAACGATLTALALDLHFYGGVLAAVAAAVCFSIRMVGVRFKLNAPVSRSYVAPKPSSTSEEGS
ncbi:MAG: TRIC cation channel family protein [Actinomycetota bacterium]|nr:TRIC cation channel family protein [Actinomycetota bacterium]